MFNSYFLFQLFVLPSVGKCQWEENINVALIFDKFNNLLIFIFQLFNRNKLPEIFDMRLLSEPVKRYSDRCVETIWRLCVQDPPLSLYWQESGKLVKTEHFNFYNQQGGYVKEAVWPAVFLCEDGPLLSKGYVLASKWHCWHCWQKTIYFIIYWFDNKYIHSCSSLGWHSYF